MMDWAAGHVQSTLYICWAAQAVLYHRYGIGKVPLKEKLSGVYRYRACIPDHPLLRGIGDVFAVPQSRYTEIPDADVRENPELMVLARSEKGGIHLVDAPAINGICMTGHPEYNARTLAREYERDRTKGIHANIPENYFVADDPAGEPVYSWQAEARTFYSNWLSHCTQKGSSPA